MPKDKFARGYDAGVAAGIQEAAKIMLGVIACHGTGKVKIDNQDLETCRVQLREMRTKINQMPVDHTGRPVGPKDKVWVTWAPEEGEQKRRYGGQFDALQTALYLDNKEPLTVTRYFLQQVDAIADCE